MIGNLTENSHLTGTLSSGTSQAVEYTAGTGIDITENVISNTITSYNDLSDTPNLSSVATSGSYNDLTDKPTIPTLTSQLQNDSGYLTNNYQVYSKTETRIGTWVDGKPVYRKCFIIEEGFGLDFAITHNIDNLGVIINVSGTSYSAGSYKQLPSLYLPNMTNYGVSVYAIDNTYVQFTLGNWAKNNVSKIILCLEYTKSND